MENIFFERLTIELERNQMSGNKLCQALGIANANYSNWKKGIPKAEIICKIADVLNTSTDYLLGRSGADPELPEDERELLKCYRRASTEGKKIIQATARASVADPEQEQAKKEA